MLSDFMMRPGPAGSSMRDGAPQGLMDGMNAPQQMMQQQGQQKPGGLSGFLQGGGLGLLPMLLAGGKLGDFKGPGMAGALGGGLPALLSSLFK